MQESTVDEKVKTALIEQAVKGLKLLYNKYINNLKSRKPNLLGKNENSKVFLQISLYKIPVVSYPSTIKIKIPHPLVTDLLDVCLFTQDLDLKAINFENTIAHFRELLAKQGIFVGQIIPYRQLRAEYKQYEALRNLAASFDVFLADGRLSKMLPAALGKKFLTKRKLPFLVKMNASNLTREFISALSKTSLTINGRGAILVVQVGSTYMEDIKLIENVEMVIAKLNSAVPGGWNNISTLHLRSSRSKAIPIYLSNYSPNDVKVPSLIPETRKPVVGELNTLTRSKVKVFPSGDIELIPQEKSDIINEATVYENALIGETLSKRKRNKVRTNKKTKQEVEKTFKIKSDDEEEIFKDIKSDEHALIGKTLLKRKRKQVKSTKENEREEKVFKEIESDDEEEETFNEIKSDDEEEKSYEDIKTERRARMREPRANTLCTFTNKEEKIAKAKRMKLLQRVPRIAKGLIRKKRK